MGDRANVFVLDDSGSSDNGVFLYTHWRGTELPFIVQNALARKLRWNDPSYLARIIFCEMIKGEESEETGFGISPSITDNEHKIICVDPETQRIGFAEGKACIPKKWIPFEEYITMKKKDINKLYL